MDKRGHSIDLPDSVTIDWLFAHRFYRRWNGVNAGLPGIRGGPGTGKSTAIKGLLESERQHQTEASIVLSYFFDRDGHSRTRSAMYRTLLYHLLRQAPDSGRELWDDLESIQDHRGGGFPFSIATLRMMFSSILNVVCKAARVCIFVDALDEAGDHEARETIADLRQIQRDVGEGADHLRICYSCRFYPSTVVENGLQIMVEEHNGEGIEAYVRGALRDDPFFSAQLDTDQIETLAGGIRAHSRGFFTAAKYSLEKWRQYMNAGCGLKEFKEDIG